MKLPVMPSIKSNVKRLILYALSPALIGRLKSLRSKLPWAPPLDWEYVSGGWQDGDADARGWNVESVANAQRERWSRFVALAEGNGPLGICHESVDPGSNDYVSHATIITFGYVIALASRRSDSLSILDWGGGAGHYGVLARTLLDGVALDYHCKDVPLLCAAGRELQPEVTFHEDEASCFSRRYDLVMASGSIHYSRDWRAAMQSLAAAADGWLYLTRIPLVKTAPSFLVRQRPYRNGYYTDYCGWFINRNELLAHADAIGLSLTREFLVSEAPVVENAPEQCQYGGFLFRIRPAKSTG
jgi:putative methyltransferase (TIGR04325 family)